MVPCAKRDTRSDYQSIDEKDGMELHPEIVPGGLRGERYGPRSGERLTKPFGAYWGLVERLAKRHAATPRKNAPAPSRAYRTPESSLGAKRANMPVPSDIIPVRVHGRGDRRSFRERKSRMPKSTPRVVRLALGASLTGAGELTRTGGKATAIALIESSHRLGTFG